METDERQSEDYRAPTYKELLWGMRWYLYLPVCLFFGIVAAVNVGLLIHIHVVEIGLYTQVDLVDDKWIYYVNTAVYTAMFSALCWLVATDAPDVAVVQR